MEKEEKCLNCKFYNPVHDIGNWQDGECRRHAPTRLSGVGDQYTEQNFPIVQGEEDWCGDYQEDSF